MPCMGLAWCRVRANPGRSVQRQWAPWRPPSARRACIPGPRGPILHAYTGAQAVEDRTLLQKLLFWGTVPPP